VKRILVVDDHEMLCHLSCDILRREGYDAVPATSATEALAAFQKQEFDLVVTDFAMPGMTGVELARAITDLKPKFPVIVISGYEPVECERVKLWLPKGYLFPILLEKIRESLEESELLGTRELAPMS